MPSKGLLILLLGLLAGCAGLPRGELRLDEAETSLVWPPPPEPPRLRWEGALRGEDNFPVQRGHGVGDVLRWLVGLARGQAAPLRLQRPLAGAVDGQRGRIYVSDPGLGALVVFDRQRRRVEAWRSAGPHPLRVPAGVAVLDDGSVWLSDAEAGRLYLLDVRGRLVTTVRHAALKRPAGLCLDGRGRLLVADSGAHRIHLFDRHGRWLASWGRKGDAPGRFNGPTHLACAHGLVAVADTLNARVQILDASGRPLRILGRRGAFLGDTPRPKGVAWDGEGHLYVVESLFDHLLVYDREGRALLPIGGSGSRPGRFQLPAGAWSDAENRIYVADMFNARVAVFRYLGGQAAIGHVPDDDRQR